MISVAQPPPPHLFYTAVALPFGVLIIGGCFSLPTDEAAEQDAMWLLHSGENPWLLSVYHSMS